MLTALIGRVLISQLVATGTGNAYWVPTVISHAPAFVSARLRNYQYNPIWDFVADQAWVR